MHQTAARWTARPAAFGKVIEGMDAVDRIANTPTDSSDRPLVDARMSSVAVDTSAISTPSSKLRKYPTK